MVASYQIAQEMGMLVFLSRIGRDLLHMCAQHHQSRTYLTHSASYLQSWALFITANRGIMAACPSTTAFLWAIRPDWDRSELQKKTRIKYDNKSKDRNTCDCHESTKRIQGLPERIYS